MSYKSDTTASTSSIFKEKSSSANSDINFWVSKLSKNSVLTSACPNDTLDELRLSPCMELVSISGVNDLLVVRLIRGYYSVIIALPGLWREVSCGQL